MNKKVIALWGFIIVALVIIIFIIGITKEEELKYISLKNDIREATKEYIENNNIKDYPFTITTEELEEKDYLDELKLENKLCVADITVTKKIIFKKYNIKFTCINIEK